MIFLDSTPNDSLAIVSRANTGQCIQPYKIRDVTKWIPGSKNQVMVTCSRHKTTKSVNPTDGNYILYKRKTQFKPDPNFLTIVKIQDDYCVPWLAECSCTNLMKVILDTIVANTPPNEITMAAYIDVIEVLLFGSSVLEPTETDFQARCLGILTPTWNAGFTHVQMEHRTNEACAVKIHMHAQNGYVDACKLYMENDCGFHTIKITKQ